MLVSRGSLVVSQGFVLSESIHCFLFHDIFGFVGYGASITRFCREAFSLFVRLIVLFVRIVTKRSCLGVPDKFEELSLFTTCSPIFVIVPSFSTKR